MKGNKCREEEEKQKQQLLNNIYTQHVDLLTSNYLEMTHDINKNIFI